MQFCIGATFTPKVAKFPQFISPRIQPLAVLQPIIWGKAAILTSTRARRNSRRLCHVCWQNRCFWAGIPGRSEHQRQVCPRHTGIPPRISSGSLASYSGKTERRVLCTMSIPQGTPALLPAFPGLSWSEKLWSSPRVQDWHVPALGRRGAESSLIVGSCEGAAPTVPVAAPLLVLYLRRGCGACRAECGATRRRLRRRVGASHVLLPRCTGAECSCHVSGPGVRYVPLAGLLRLSMAHHRA